MWGHPDKRPQITDTEEGPKKIKNANFSVAAEEGPSAAGAAVPLGLHLPDGHCRVHATRFGGHRHPGKSAPTGSYLFWFLYSATLSITLGLM